MDAKIPMFALVMVLTFVPALIPDHIFRTGASISASQVVPHITDHILERIHEASV